MKGGNSGNNRKKVEAQQLQIEIKNNEEWAAVLTRPGLLVVDVYSSWCGPCTSMAGNLRRIKMEFGDDGLILAMAEADKISDLVKFRNKAEPTFLLFGCGKPLCSIHGANGPALVNIVRERLAEERDIIKKKKEKRSFNPVLLNSLVKPEENLETDEDLDDLESDRLERENEENEGRDSEGVLFISSNIIATEKTEEFLSQIVSSDIVIVGHVQEELSREEFHSLLFWEEESAREEEEKETGGKAEEGEDGGQKVRENPKTVKEEELDKYKEEHEYWENELSKGPLYMILIKVEDGNIYESWELILGPSDFRKAQLNEPSSLVAQFGEKNAPVPAWLPKCPKLQQRLRVKFFPTPDEALPRLLILPDEEDHKKILESLCRRRIQVHAHTQILLTKESLNALDLSSSAENIQDMIGFQMLAAVVSGENVVQVSSDLRSLHLTLTAENSVKEISQFFPDLATELVGDPSDPSSLPGHPRHPGQQEPQTQFQIEQKKEKYQN